MSLKNFFTIAILVFSDVIKSIKTNSTSDNGISENEDVLFYLYTRNNLNDGQELKIDDEKILNDSVYDINSPTKLVTHGWRTDCTVKSCNAVKDGFLNGSNYNVILVDWSSISKSYYPTIFAKVKYVGKKVAKFINFLINYGSNPNNMTLVGHSLGAHVMGIAGNKASTKIAHIVGLDPASPGFGLLGEGNELTKQDANLVEIIHTNAGMLGIAIPIGHVDFYPNGGNKQPGCGLDLFGWCSHERSSLLFAEALIDPSRFLAIRCDSYMAFMKGECATHELIAFADADPISKLHGRFMLHTRATSPYGLGVEGTRSPFYL